MCQNVTQCFHAFVLLDADDLSSKNGENGNSRHEKIQMEFKSLYSGHFKSQYN